MSENEEEIEIEIEIDENGEILFSRDHEATLEIAKEISPEDIGSLECFIENKPKTIEGDKNYESFCG